MVSPLAANEQFRLVSAARGLYGQNSESVGTRRVQDPPPWSRERRLSGRFRNRVTDEKHVRGDERATRGFCEGPAPPRPSEYLRSEPVLPGPTRPASLARCLSLSARCRRCPTASRLPAAASLGLTSNACSTSNTIPMAFTTQSPVHAPNSSPQYPPSIVLLLPISGGRKKFGSMF